MIIKKNKINKFFIFLLIFKNIFGSNSINLNDFFKISVTSLISIGGSFAVFYNFLYKPLKIENNSYKKNIKYLGGIAIKYDSHIRNIQENFENLKNSKNLEYINLIKKNYYNNNKMLEEFKITSDVITKLDKINNILKEIIKINDPQSFNLFYQEGSDNLDLDNDLKKAKELLKLKIEQNKNENTNKNKNTQKIYPININNNFNYNYQQNNIMLFGVRYNQQSQNNFSELNTENLNQKNNYFNSEFTEPLEQNDKMQTPNYNTLNYLLMNKDFEKFKYPLNPLKNTPNFKFFGSKIKNNNKDE